MELPPRKSSPLETVSVATVNVSSCSYIVLRNFYYRDGVALKTSQDQIV